jgi:MFS family permease
VSGAATAALAELHPRGARRQAALIASVATAGGTALGPLLAGILAQYEPWPAVLPFVVHLILFVPGVLALLFIPESVHAKSTGVWRPQRPGVPTEIRPSFVIGSATAFIAWP